jgi:dephospho-CoA kinase
LKKKIKIAVTGSIGSGKSEFCRIAEKFGFVVLRADEISKKLLSENETVKKKVSSLFGVQAYNDVKPNLKYLAEIVFSDPEKLKKLESILHPIVIKKIKKLSDETLKDKDVVFIESALIYEADIEDSFDYVVLITAPREIRLNRKLQNGFSEDDFIKREQNQIPDEEKKKRADFIFNNDKTVAELEQYFKILCLTLNISI